MFQKDPEWPFLLPDVGGPSADSRDKWFAVAWLLTQDSAVVFIYDFISAEEPERKIFNRQLNDGGPRTIYLII